jgi:uncharacterized membrane protein
MTKDATMHLIDSLKTYAVVLMGWIVTAMHWTCDVLEHVTIILVFVLTVVRLINDIPKARDAIRRIRRKG